MSSPPDSFTEEEVEVALILRHLPELVLEDERRRSRLRLRWGFKKKRSSPGQDASPLPPSLAANEDEKSKPATVLSSHPSIGVEDSSAPEIPPPPVKQDEKLMRKEREDSSSKRKDVVVPSHTIICQSSGRGPAESDMGGVSPAFSLKRPRLTLDLNERPADEQEEASGATEWQLRRQQLISDAAFARKRRIEIRRAKLSSAAAAAKIYLRCHVRHGDGI